jgi:hypothetical protein
MTSSSSFIRRQIRRACAGGALAVACAAASAAPGAHGPNGEHLDGPAQAVAGAQHPRVEARSELFELVAQLKGGELSILIDHYDSNEPVLGAGLEVESGALKATASFRAESGDYVVTDAALLKALAAPGQHPLVFTLVAGKESDLLDATLVIGGVGNRASGHGHAHDDDHDHDHDHHHGFSRKRIAAAGVAVLGLGLMATFWWRRRQRGNVVAARGVQA